MRELTGVVLSNFSSSHTKIRRDTSRLTSKWHGSRAITRCPSSLAPPRSRGGKINGASGSVLQLGSGVFIVTASHVLEGYETRIQAGEVLNWQVGDLPPFDLISRIAWRSR